MIQGGRFEACLARTLIHEGGWSDDPIDPGGPTNKGIILRVYAAYLGRPPSAEVVALLKRIPDDHVRDIYYRNYWLLVRGDELPPGVDLAVFDYGVNSGPGTSIKKLQRCLAEMTGRDVKADGHIGPVTMEALRCVEHPALISKFMDSRRAYLRSLRTFWRFGRGWMRRCDEIEREALTDCTAVSAGYQRPSYEPSVLITPGGGVGRATVDEKTTMAASTTGHAAGAIGTGSGASLGMETAATVAELNAKGKPWTFVDVVLAMASKPSFWITVGTLIAAIYVWLERRRKMKEGTP